MLTYSEGFGFLEAVALQILMFSWRLVSYDGEIHCVIVMKRAAQIGLSPDDVTQLFAWRGSIGDTFCNHLGLVVFLIQIVTLKAQLLRTLFIQV